MRQFNRVALVVLDGVGCGEAEDTKAEFPQDAGANSLLHASRTKPLNAPAFGGMGLEYVPGLEGLRVAQHTAWRKVRGAVGALSPTFAGNGSPEGHQALTGYEVITPYLLFNRTGFPPELVSRIEHVVEKIVGRPVQVIRYPGTDDINGEKFFQNPSIGIRHYASRDPSGPFLLPIYASSDSLIQVALHVDVVSLSIMEEICRAIRTEALAGKFKNVARVILRVWGGEPDNFKRLSQNRKDFGVDPDGVTIVDHLSAKGIQISAVGKAAEMLNGRGFDESRIVKGETDEERIRSVASIMRSGPGSCFVFANLKDTDEKSGHTRKPELYVDHLNAASRGIGEVISVMRDDDLLIVTSDHGNDPTCPNHTNHTRERVPILVASPRIIHPVELGVRSTYLDVAATLAEIFEIDDKLTGGKSFLRELVD